MNILTDIDIVDEIEQLPQTFNTLFGRAYYLISQRRYLFDLPKPIWVYLYMAIVMVRYLHYHSAKLSTSTYYNEFFAFPKNRGWVIYTDEVLLINCIIYQILRNCKRYTNTMFKAVVLEQIGKIMKWHITKAEYNKESASYIWHTLDGQQMSFREQREPQNIIFYVKNLNVDNVEKLALGDNVGTKIITSNDTR